MSAAAVVAVLVTGLALQQLGRDKEPLDWRWRSRPRHQRDVPQRGRGRDRLGKDRANITGVASAAAVTTEGVSQSQQAPAELSRMSAELRELVGTFRV